MEVITVHDIPAKLGYALTEFQLDPTAPLFVGNNIESDFSSAVPETACSCSCSIRMAQIEGTTILGLNLLILASVYLCYLLPHSSSPLVHHHSFGCVCVEQGLGFLVVYAHFGG